MSFRGKNFRGHGRGGRGHGFKRRLFQDEITDVHVIPLGHLSHTCQDDLVIKSHIHDVPYFNAPIFTEDKKQIGRIDDIFGRLNDYYVSVKLSDEITPKSFKLQQKLFIDGSKLLPLQRFLPQTSKPKPHKQSKNARGRGKIGEITNFRHNKRDSRVNNARPGRGNRQRGYFSGSQGRYFRGRQRR